MSEKLTAKIFDFFITTKCTMNCKLCAAAVPYNQHPHHTPKDVAFREIKEFFKIWDFAERVEFIGGEPLMHPEIYEIIKETLKYHDQFDRLRITTNATIIPDDKLLALVRDCGKYFDFIVDDYGQYSKNLNGLVEKLKQYDIPHRIDVYHGDNQRYDGWIDFGNYTDRGYSEEKVKEVYHKCIAPKNQFVCVNDGKVFPCCYGLSVFLTQGILPLENEYVDLFDDTVSRSEKRVTAGKFYDADLYSACRYCKGFDSTNAQRYSAAEQLERKIGGTQ